MEQFVLFLDFDDILVRNFIRLDALLGLFSSSYWLGPRHHLLRPIELCKSYRYFHPEGVWLTNRFGAPVHKKHEHHTNRPLYWAKTHDILSASSNMSRCYKKIASNLLLSMRVLDKQFYVIEGVAAVYPLLCEFLEQAKSTIHVLGVVFIVHPAQERFLNKVLAPGTECPELSGCSRQFLTLKQSALYYARRNRRLVRNSSQVVYELTIEHNLYHLSGGDVGERPYDSDPLKELPLSAVRELRSITDTLSSLVLLLRSFYGRTWPEPLSDATSPSKLLARWSRPSLNPEIHRRLIGPS